MARIHVLIAGSACPNRLTAQNIRTSFRQGSCFLYDLKTQAQQLHMILNEAHLGDPMACPTCRTILLQHMLACAGRHVIKYQNWIKSSTHCSIWFNDVPGWHTGKKTRATSMSGRVASTVGKTLIHAVESPTRLASGELSNQAHILIPAGAGISHT